MGKGVNFSNYLFADDGKEIKTEEGRRRVLPKVAKRLMNFISGIKNVKWNLMQGNVELWN